MKKIMFLGLMMACLLSGCKKENPLREGIRADIEEWKKQLPMEIGGITIQTADVKEDLVVYDCLVDETAEMIQADSILNSDKNYARTLASMDEMVVKNYIDAGMGVKYIYKDKESKIRGVMTITAQKMKEIQQKLKSGEIKPFSFLEMTQVEINQSEYPLQVSENLWLTDAMVKDNYVINVFTIEAVIEKSSCTEEEWWETKKNTIEGLRESPLVRACREEIKEKDIHLSYVYKDVRDTILSIIDIDYYDLFN